MDNKEEVSTIVVVAVAASCLQETSAGDVQEGWWIVELHHIVLIAVPKLLQSIYIVMLTN